MKTYQVKFPIKEKQEFKVTNSSNILHISYEPVVLTVRFSDNSVYEYRGRGVKSLYSKLKRENSKSVNNSERSVGKLFNKIVKENTNLRWKKIN